MCIGSEKNRKKWKSYAIFVTIFRKLCSQKVEQKFWRCDHFSHKKSYALFVIIFCYALTTFYSSFVLWPFMVWYLELPKKNQKNAKATHFLLPLRRNFRKLCSPNFLLTWWVCDHLCSHDEWVTNMSFLGQNRGSKKLKKSENFFFFHLPSGFFWAKILGLLDNMVTKLDHFLRIFIFPWDHDALKNLGHFIGTALKY